MELSLIFTCLVFQFAGAFIKPTDSFWCFTRRAAKQHRNIGCEIASWGSYYRPEYSEIWSKKYELLRKYKAEHGHCLVPQNLIVDGTIQLGHWVARQRVMYAKEKISADRVQLLENLGFAWDRQEEDWNRKFELLRLYREAHGNCLVPKRYITEDGVKLGRWVGTQRALMVKGDIKEYRKALLYDLGMRAGQLEEEWNNKYNILKRYDDAHGDCFVSDRYVDPTTGIHLGKWLVIQRRAMAAGELTESKLKLMEALGISVDRNLEKWNSKYKVLCRYHEIHGNCDVTGTYVDRSGVKLGEWVEEQRRMYAQGEINDRHISLLDDLGFVWCLSDLKWDCERGIEPKVDEDIEPKPDRAIIHVEEEDKWEEGDSDYALGSYGVGYYSSNFREDSSVLFEEDFSEVKLELWLKEQGQAARMNPQEACL